jgi:hypothetical protein
MEDPDGVGENNLWNETSCNRLPQVDDDIQNYNVILFDCSVSCG